jgi:hypothetical protein
MEVQEPVQAVEAVAAAEEEEARMEAAAAVEEQEEPAAEAEAEEEQETAFGGEEEMEGLPQQHPGMPAVPGEQTAGCCLPGLAGGVLANNAGRLLCWQWHSGTCHSPPPTSPCLPIISCLPACLPACSFACPPPAAEEVVEGLAGEEVEEEELAELQAEAVAEPGAEAEPEVRGQPPRELCGCAQR